MESSRYLSTLVVACGDEAQYLYNLVLKEINVCTETMTVRGTMVRDVWYYTLLAVLIRQTKLSNKQRM